MPRYHRKSHPKKKHDNFNRLTKEKQEIVKLLGGILRIAEGIDRRQLKVVNKVKADYHNGIINIYMHHSANEIIPDIEIWGANRRKSLLEATFDKKVNFHLVADG